MCDLCVNTLEEIRAILTMPDLETLAADISRIACSIVPGKLPSDVVSFKDIYADLLIFVPKSNLFIKTYLFSALCSGKTLLRSFTRIGALYCTFSAHDYSARVLSFASSSVAVTANRV